MYSPSTLRNIFLALLLSLAATFLAVAAYTFYPLISALVAALPGSRAGGGSGGIGAVAGGVAGSFLPAVLIAEPVLFLVIFALLQRRRALS